MPSDLDVAFEPVLDAWAPWHPREIARLLAGLDVPWYVAGGWALDLFRGEATRAHGDLETAVPAHRFAAIAERLRGFELFVIGGGKARPLSAAGAADEHHQTWVREPASKAWRLDIFREPSEGGVWVCRRAPRLRRPYRELIAYDGEGTPYGAPEVILLFKAKAARPKDEADFASVLPLLAEGQRRGFGHPTACWPRAPAAGRALARRGGASPVPLPLETVANYRSFVLTSSG